MTTMQDNDPVKPAPAEIAAVVMNGGTIGGAVGLSDESLEALYSVGYNQYQQAQYDQSLITFKLLCLSNHRLERHWLGLGATQQRLANHEGAVLAYSMAAEIGSTNPEAPLRAAECYLALGMIDEAIAGLQQAVLWADNARDPRHIEQQVERLSAAVRHALESASQKEPTS